MVVLTMLGTALWYYSTFELNYSIWEEKNARAYYIARAGTESLARHIVHDPSIVKGIAVGETRAPTDIKFGLEYSDTQEEKLDILIKRISLDNIEIKGTGTVDGVKQTVSMVLEAEERFEEDSFFQNGAQFQNNATIIGDYVIGEGEEFLPEPGPEDNYSVKEQTLNFHTVEFKEEPTYAGEYVVGEDLQKHGSGNIGYDGEIVVTVYESDGSTHATEGKVSLYSHHNLNRNSLAGNPNEYDIEPGQEYVFRDLEAGEVYYIEVKDVPGHNEAVHAQEIDPGTVHEVTIFLIETGDDYDVVKLIPGDPAYNPDPAYEDITFDNGAKLIIDASSDPFLVEVNNFTMANNSGLELRTSEDPDASDKPEESLRIYANDVVLDHVEVSGHGTAYLYVRDTLNVQTPSAMVIAETARLIVFLEEGAVMEMQANSFFEGLVYGPEATVGIKGNADFYGGMIVENIVGNQGSITVGSAGTTVSDSPKYSWDFLGLDYGGYWMVQWVR